jgi:hypothetical protein
MHRFNFFFFLLTSLQETTHGNPRYVAVEVMMRQHDVISAASDVWSWGFVLWEVASGSVAFGSYKPPQISRKIWEAGDRPDLEDVKVGVFSFFFSASQFVSPGSFAVQDHCAVLEQERRLAPDGGAAHRHLAGPRARRRRPRPQGAQGVLFLVCLFFF